MALGQTSLAHPCSNLRFSEANVPLWKKCLWHSCDFCPPAVICRAGNCAPLPPSLRLRCYEIKIGKFSEHKLIFKSECHELLFHEHLQFSNTTGLQIGSYTDCQQGLLAAFQVSCFTSNPAPRVFSTWTCVCFSNDKAFPTFSKLIFWS